MATNKAAKKTPLQLVKEELQYFKEHSAKLEETVNVLESRLDAAKEANSALSAKLHFEDEYEGLRTFLLERLKNKRSEFVNSLFTNVRETINTAHMCKLSSLKDASSEANKVLTEIGTKMNEVSSRML